MIHDSTFPAPLDAALLDRVEYMQATAEYITCLLTVVGDTVDNLCNAARAGVIPDATLAEAAEWRMIRTLLNLADDQTQIVATVAQAVERARMGKAA